MNRLEDPALGDPNSNLGSSGGGFLSTVFSFQLRLSIFSDVLLSATFGLRCMAGRLFRSISRRHIKPSPYRLVKQNTKSSSPLSHPTSSDIMLGDIDFDDSSEARGKMSQIEMHNVFLGSPTGAISSNDHDQHKELLPSKRKKSKSRGFRSPKASELPLPGRLRRIFFKDKTSVLDTRNRTIRYQEGEISIFRDNLPFPKRKCTRNTINNQKYSFWSFFPLFLFEQFNQFWNLYFLFVAITQLPIPGSIFEDFWIGYWWTTVMVFYDQSFYSLTLFLSVFDSLNKWHGI